MSVQDELARHEMVQQETVPGVAITGCGVVSPAGVGLERLGQLMAGRSTGNSQPIEEDSGQFPAVAVRTVPPLRLADYVGRKGTRRLDRMVGHALVATKLALISAGRDSGRDPGSDGDLRDHTGVAMGTSTGSVRSVWELAQAGHQPDYSYVPSRFPNSVMNSCAGQIAVWNSLKAVNVTLASGHLSSTSAIRYARNALRRGHARSVVVGGIEELCPQVAWGWHNSGTLAPEAVLGEGCALLVTEADYVTGGRPVLAELLAAEVGYASPAARDRGLGPEAALARCIIRALAVAGIEPAGIDLVSLGAGSQLGLRRVESVGLRRALGFMPERIRVSDAVGDCYSAGGAMQAAAVLARWSGGAHPDESHALVTSVGPDGGVGCFLLRRPARSAA